ncbi:MAG: SIMPL domain-containing protein [Caldilineaceae bacterium]
MRIKRYTMVAVALALTGMVALQVLPSPDAQIAFAQQAGDQNPATRSISVSGSGQANVQPDVAVVQVGVETSATEAAAALSANSEKMQSLINALQDAGVAQEDIQTQMIQLQPQYSDTQTGMAPGTVAPQSTITDTTGTNMTPQITGYIATNAVEIRTTDLANLGTLLDQVVAAGGNQISNIRFDISNATDALASARETAWQDAQQKAEQLANLAGAQLGDVLSINEYSQGPVPLAEASLSARAASGVPVQPGTQNVNVQLQVTWQLQ